MDINGTYILNPAYYLRNDVKRCLIGAYDEARFPDLEFDSNITCHIHPANAQMLSFFDGKRTLAECITDIAGYFDLEQEQIKDILSNYIENPQRIFWPYKNQLIILPKNVLVDGGKYLRREYYNVDDFICGDDIDLSYGRQYKPLSAIFELTMTCYTDCIYCYADRKNPCAKKALSVEQIKKIIRDAKSIQLPELDINGGEVLMHPHFKEIALELVANGYFPLISTKAPISEEMMVFLKQNGLTKVQISIDSINPKTLATILNTNQQYFSRIKSTMDMLDEMGFDWQTNSIITKFNNSLEDEIIPLMSLLTQYKNIKSIRIGPAGFSLYKSPDFYNSIKLSLASIERIEQYIQELEKEERLKIDFVISSPDTENDYNSKRHKEQHFDHRSVCTGNQRSFVILPDGKVTICEELYWHPNFIIGDLTKQSILEVWNSDKAISLFNITQNKMQPESQCKMCGVFDKCRGYQGVCWKIIVGAYGPNNWSYPDPRCPQAPACLRKIYLE